MDTDSAKSSLAVILLAAGESSRLGQMKQLVTINENTLIERQLRLSLTISKDVYCVLGHKAEEIYQYIEHLPTTALINSNWKSGLGSSIATGVNALPKHIDAAMILLVDQWQLSINDFASCLQQWHCCPRGILAASNNEKLGPPVIFSRQYFSELGKLNGKDGAKTLLKKYQSNVHRINLPHAFNDLDTPSQLMAMKAITNRKF